MKKEKEIEINGEIYIKKSEIKDFKPSEVRIVVLNRGWVTVGKVKQKDNKTFISSASIIRRWGTENGLGELAEKGPLSNTILDKCPDIEVDTINIVFIMNCNQENWINI